MQKYTKKSKMLTVAICFSILASFYAGAVYADSWNPPDIGLDDLPSPYDFVVKTDGTYYWLIAKNGTVLTYSTNKTEVEETALSNSGIVFLQGFQHNNSLTVSSDSVVLESYGGNLRVFDSLGGRSLGTKALLAPFYMYDDMDGTLRWLKVGNGADYNAVLSTDYYRQGAKSLKVTTRTSEQAEDDYSFAYSLAPLSSATVLNISVARLSGYFGYFFNSYTKYIQFEIAFNDGTYTHPAEIRYDKEAGTLTYKNEDGDRTIFDNAVDYVSYDVWTQFELCVDLTVNRYIGFYMMGYNGTGYEEHYYDLSDQSLILEGGGTNKNIQYYVGVVSAVAETCQVYFDDVTYSGAS